MIIKYIQDIGIRFLDIKIDWGTHRSVVRELLSGKFIEENSITDLSSYNNGSPEFNIYQLRDVYTILYKKECLVFFNYDKEDLLRDIEIHYGISMKIDAITLSFEKGIDEIIVELKTVSNNFNVIDFESYFFVDLKLVVASNESMGGVGNNLGYIFISKDVTHLLQVTL